MKKTLLLWLLAVSLAFAGTLTHVNLQLAWKYQFQFAGYIMAKEKGFYEAAGLDVALKEYENGMSVTKEVEEGRADFAVGRTQLITDRLNENKPYVMLMALAQASPVMIQTTTQSGIKSLEDFRGKRIAISGDVIPVLIADVLSMFASAGLNPSDFTFVPAKTYGPEDITSGYADAITAYATITPYHLQTMGYEPVSFHPKDYGFDFYGDILFTTESFIHNHPKITQAFHEATLKGWHYAFANVDETIHTIKTKYDTQKLSKDILEFEAREFKKLAFTKHIPFGDINPIKIEKIVNSFRHLGVVNNPKNDFESFVYTPPSAHSAHLTEEERAYVEDNPIIRIGVRQNCKPYDYHDASGLHSGIARDILHLIEQRTGFRFLHVSGDFETLLGKLKSGEIDAIGMSPEVDGLNLLYSPSYIQMKMALFGHHSEAKAIGVLPTRYGLEHILKAYPNATPIEFQNSSNALDALLDSRIDLLYGPKASIVDSLKNRLNANIALVELPQDFSPEPLHVAFDSGSILRHNIVSKALNSLTEDEKTAIQNRWIPTLIKQEKDLSWVWKAFGLIGLIVFVLVYKQRTHARLNKQLTLKEKALQKAHDKLKIQAHRDPLTNLHNRRYFNESAQKLLALSLRQNFPMCLLLMDLDYFKRYNDTYGHGAGDEALKCFAKMLQTLSRQMDVVARFGGEEFIMLLPHTDIKGAQALAKRIQEGAESLHVNNKELFPFTVSVGVSALDASWENIEQLWKRADEALYQAKRDGRNKVVVID